MKTAAYEFCEEQINRLSWKKGFPKSQEVKDFATGDTRFENPGMEVLAKALQGIAGDNPHAQRIVDELQETLDTCPTPSQIREIALNVPGPARKPCQKCNGTGFISTENCAGIRFSTRCKCVGTA